MATIQQLKDIASQLRRDVIRMTSMAGCGHPGGSMSSTDIMTALYFHAMKQNPAKWDRSGKGQDVFILSAGHLAPIYYAALARAGYFPASELGTLRKMGSRLQGHPGVEQGLPGIFQASGSLGQGLSCAEGYALGKKVDGDPCKVYCLLGDGEQEEGQVWEAAMFGPKMGLDNLVAITDWNHLQIDGDVDKVGGVGDLEAKWTDFGWNVIVVEDGNDMQQILDALDKAGKAEGKPTMILLKTVMAKGVSFMENNHKWHGTVTGPEDTAKAMAELKETLGDF